MDIDLRKPDGGLTKLLGSRDGAAYYANAQPDDMEASRLGDRFILGYSAAVTGIAPVQAMPTTAAQWSIANPDPLLSQFFEEIGVYLTSGTPGVAGVLLYCTFRTPLAASSDAGISVVNANQGASKASKAIVKSGQSITAPTAPTWYPIASDPSPNVTAFAGSTFLEHRQLKGSIVVPPNFSLGLAVLAPTGTSPLFAPFAKWLERVNG